MALPPGDVIAAPAGIIMYRPGGSKSEGDMRDDPLYKGLKKAGLFGGSTSAPFLSLKQGPGGPMLPGINMSCVSDRSCRGEVAR